MRAPGGASREMMLQKPWERADVGWPMAEQAPVDWPTCDQDGCIGIQLGAGRVCLAHAGAEERDAELRRIGESGEIDLRGISIRGHLLDRVIAVAPRNANQMPLIKTCKFNRATFQAGAGVGEAAPFEGDADFAGATFQGRAVFGEATFQGRADFTRATFQGRAVFGEATFQGRADFTRATFEGDAVFGEATFEYGAEFAGATCQGRVEFAGATFEGDAEFARTTFQNTVWTAAIFQHGADFTRATFQASAWFAEATFQHAAGFARAIFLGATFQGGAWFHNVTFQCDASFTRATFQNGAWFTGATFQHAAQFDGATFKGDADFADVEFRRKALFVRAGFDGTRRFGPLLAHRGLVLDDAQFEQPVQIELSTVGVCCRRARFPAGVQFRLRWARLVLDETDFPAPSILYGIPRLAASEALAAQEARIAKAWQRLLAGDISEQPRLLSLQRTNVAGLGLNNIDMADCRLAGAHNLDKLRLEADVSFATAPSRLGQLSQGGWRQVIAEERAWRAGRSRHWMAPLWPDWLDDARPEVLNPGQIAGLYRALRKGREDIKDEPGAADFYYGEMEMRRHAHRPSHPEGSGGASWGRVERSILTAYWLVSGYGLRGWRSLAWLAAITAILAFAFHHYGFVRPPQPDTYWTSLLYAFRATLSLTDPEVTLTAWGKFLQAVLRLTGPVLLGLAILALRGRVKR